MELWHIIISIAIIVAIAVAVWYFIFRDISNVPPSAPSNINYRLVGNTLTLSWNAVTDATMYKVFLGTQPGKYPTPRTSNTTSILFDKIIGCSKYYVAIQSIKGKLESALSTELVIDTSLRAPTITYVAKRANFLRVDIEYDTMAKKYVVEIGKNVNEFPITEKTDNGNFQIDISKLGECSKLFVRASTMSDNCKSPYSVISTYEPENPPQQSKIERVWKDGNEVYVQWLSVGRQGEVMYGVEFKFGDREYVQAGPLTPHLRIEKGLNLPTNMPSMIRVKAMKMNSCASYSEPFTFDPKNYQENNYVTRTASQNSEQRKTYQY